MAMTGQQLDDWFGRLPDGDNTPQAAEKQALQDFLTGSTTADDAAERVNSIVAEADDPEDKLYYIWTLVDQAAEDLPDVHDKLIALLAALKRLPDLSRDGRPITVYGKYHVWRDLPTLAEDLRTRWDYYDDGSNSQSLQVQRRKFVNINAFLARITSHRLIDLKHMAIWTLRLALEDTPWTRQLPQAVRPPPGQARPNIRMLDGLVPGAAQWITHAGPLIHSSQEEYGRLAQGGDLFQGKQGFSRERWNFWKARFRWVQSQGELREETRAIARKAAEAMEKIDYLHASQMGGELTRVRTSR